MRRLIPAGAPAADTAPTITPRATMDLDATFRGEMKDLVSAVEAALGEPRHGFSFRTAVETPDAPHMVRFRVRVSYHVKGVGGLAPQELSSVRLEVSRYEGTHYPPDMVPAVRHRGAGVSPMHGTPEADRAEAARRDGGARRRERERPLP